MMNKHLKGSQELGNTDYILNGEIVENVPVICVMISAETDLELLSDYRPGTVAYTAGFANAWQKSAAGEWVSMTEE